MLGTPLQWAYLVLFLLPMHTHPNELVVPVPGPEESLRETSVLTTWYEALSSVVGVEIPHDLLAIWHFPVTGGSALVGPAALAEDELRVPLPLPRIGAPQLSLLEAVIRDAGYGSVSCFACRTERDDVGLMLVASFAPGMHDSETKHRLAAVARRIAPTLARLADPDRPDIEPNPEAAVVDALAAATRLAHTPRGFARGASTALDRLIPHERLDIFVPGASPEQVYRLSAHEEGGLWSDSTLIVPRDLLDPSAAFGGRDVVLLSDALMEAGWTGWAESDRHGAVRSALGVRLVVAERVVGYLLLGGDAVGVYDAYDADLLNRLAPWIASRVEALVQSHQLKIIRAQLGSANAIPTQLRRMATILATVPDFSTGLREYMAEATALLPFHRVRLALRAEQPDRVILLVPGDHRHLGEISSTPVASPVVTRVIAGEVPHGVMGGGAEIELVFPLRAGGHNSGALILTTSAADAFTRLHLAMAQQVADGIAPWVELLRAIPSEAAGATRR
jgi:GAF domain-containing protein